MDNLGPFLLKHKDLRLKKVLTVHDISPIMLPLHFERIVHDCIIRFDSETVLPRLIQNTDLTIVDSYSTMKDLIDRFKVDNEKLAVIPLGVDTSFF